MITFTGSTGVNRLSDESPWRKEKYSYC